MHVPQWQVSIVIHLSSGKNTLETVTASRRRHPHDMLFSSSSIIFSRPLEIVLVHDLFQTEQSQIRARRSSIAIQIIPNIQFQPRHNLNLLQSPTRRHPHRMPVLWLLIIFHILLK
jgi:hypothetical protein